jgi:recombinational DNA repair protein RecR
MKRPLSVFPSAAELKREVDAGYKAFCAKHNVYAWICKKCGQLKKTDWCDKCQHTIPHRSQQIGQLLAKHTR